MCRVEGKDTTDTIRRFGEVLEEFLLFRQQEARPASIILDSNGK
ncbi:hypothetical protein SpAn4DRAFT_0459 [Sporomusa ovata]|uniref:Uncharacterized protein n=1 Tax=Sporomusa ovata TaxID=2378 RepID=A0A0U1L2S2_9FIRM|nr:hypothetical protein SpAn4DRAFT_0459 [Sporomusa ovata]